LEQFCHIDSWCHSVLVLYCVTEHHCTIFLHLSCCCQLGAHYQLFIVLFCHTQMLHAASKFRLIEPANSTQFIQATSFLNIFTGSWAASVSLGSRGRAHTHLPLVLSPHHYIINLRLQLWCSPLYKMSHVLSDISKPPDSVLLMN
jgi:hypothetical protein